METLDLVSMRKQIPYFVDGDGQLSAEERLSASRTVQCHAFCRCPVGYQAVNAVLKV